MDLVFQRFGRTRKSSLEALTDTYAQRLNHHFQVQRIETKDTTDPKAIARIVAWGRDPASRVIALEERGESWTSPDLAKKMARWNLETRRVVFVVGGPHGLDPQIIANCDHQWALSAGTLTADFAWALAHEQVYRAGTINRGEPYHHA